jgi:hypothetical protein
MAPWSYEKIETFDELYKYIIIDDKRPQIPSFTFIDQPIYKFLINLMKDCWKKEQNKRPNMNDIVDLLIENSEKFCNDMKVENLDEII